jgi:hypothetical protein
VRGEAKPGGACLSVERPLKFAQLNSHRPMKKIVGANGSSYVEMFVGENLREVANGVLFPRNVALVAIAERKQRLVEWRLSIRRSIWPSRQPSRSEE